MTVNAATSCNAQIVTGTAVAIKTYVDVADAKTIPSTIACNIQAVTRIATELKREQPLELNNKGGAI